MEADQRRMLLELRCLRDQIKKGHFLNVHFRAFALSDMAWKAHIAASSSANRAGLREEE